MVLLTTLYHPKDNERAKEYKKCLEYNLQNPYIQKIVIFYEKDNIHPEFQEIFNQNNIKVHHIKERATYKDFIEYCNKKFKNEICIIANGDIYFDNSLSYLIGYDLTNKFLGITRYNFKNGDWIREKAGSASTDSWVFKAPLISFDNDIKLGMPGCDTYVCRKAYDAGLEVINPALTIHSYHLHKSKERNYGNKQDSYHRKPDYLTFSPGITHLSTDSKKLSILICSLQERKHFLNRLLSNLQQQINKDIEILIDNEKAITIGAKRSKLLRQAKGDYIAFIDDDDLISNDYIDKVLYAISTGCDCVGIEGIITFDGRKPKKFIHSLKYKKWFNDDKAYYRNPNHLNPVKKELALKADFPNLSDCEDRVYSTRLLNLLKTETYIDEPIYFYQVRSEK